MKAAIGIYAGMGLLVILICVPMILEMVPPNNWYGFRTRRTLSDPNVWYPANRIAGQYLAVAGVVIVEAKDRISADQTCHQKKAADCGEEFCFHCRGFFHC